MNKMLTDSVKKNIQDTFKNLKTTLPLFIPRKAQNYLIAEFGKTLAGEYSEPRIFVTEAGTGIGKSLSYLVSAIPYALEEDCKLVISTATVALQEQLVEKDLPLVHQASPQHFSFMLAKGRQRYICAEKLLAIASHSSGNESQFALLETKPTDDDMAQIQRLSEAYNNQKWDGDRDNWHEVIPIICGMKSLQIAMFATLGLIFIASALLLKQDETSIKRTLSSSITAY